MWVKFNPCSVAGMYLDVFLKSILLHVVKSIKGRTKNNSKKEEQHYIKDRMLEKY